MDRQPQAGLVYSTDAGRMCPACRQPVAACRCGDAVPMPSGDGVVRVSRATQRRGGKTVTVVQGLALEPQQLAALAKRLRTSCGAGGTVKAQTVELQGDHVDRVIAHLRAEGRTVKRAGG